MKVGELVKKKGFEVIAVDADTSVHTAMAKMVDRNIGALLVMENSKIAGMFTERDVLRCWAKNIKDDVSIKEVMTKDLIVAGPEDDISYAMSIMIQKGVRHLPVVDQGGKVLSVLSMRDVVKAQVSNLEAEVHYLKDFITETG